MINISVVEGRLTVDPVLKTTLHEGKEFCAFSIAQNQITKGGEQKTEYFDVSVWGSAAKYVCDRFGKGDLIVVYGRLHTRRYEGRDGVKRVAMEIMARDVSLSQNRQNFATACEAEDFEEVGA